MSLRWRLLVLIALLTVLPALPAAWVTYDLLGRAADIGLREEIDEALESGVRLARSGLQAQRSELEAEARKWTEQLDRAGGDVTRVDPSFADPRVRVVLGEVVVQEGEPELAPPEPSVERNAPPLRLTERVPTGGTALVLTRAVDPTWREDALHTSEALQMVRSLRSQRASIERGFLLPFVVIYGIGLLLAILIALALTRGWARRVDRLVDATDAVAAGDWEVQVGMTGNDELARLGQGFDRMVHTLDAQSRHLVDMETMAGWREMARALAHEVKNPLTPIQLTVEEMRERYDGPDDEYRALLDECTRIVVDEVASLREVVGRFRDFSRPVELEKRPVDVNALLADVGAMQRDLAVEFDLDESAPRVSADEDRLRQLLMNLASNAREATKGEAQARLSISSRRTGEGVRICFEDDGPGIPPADRDRVFEPYRTGKQAGLGLGLALVKGIVLAHEGNITVDEGKWGGARFVIELPAAAEVGP